jgi:hypothetical protein
MRLTQCPACGRAVSMLRDGELCTHGPGPDGEFVCPGSGDSNMVEAALHLHVELVPQAQERRQQSTGRALRHPERRL